MEDLQLQARRWRDRAEQLRALATTMDHRTAVADLLFLADRWEIMATECEARARAEGSTRRASDKPQGST